MNHHLNRRSVLFCAGSVAVFFAGCTSKTDPPTGTAGGAVIGAADTHCAAKAFQATVQASCHPPAVDAGTMDAGPEDAGPPKSEYGETLFNTEGDDDDCKYHVSWSSTPIRQKTDVTFTVVAATKTDKMPATKGASYTEIFLNETHPAPNTKVTTTETSPGTYSIAPVQFDAPGKWTVRFHFFGDCEDLNEDSPHGHAAFFVNVP